MQAFNSNQSESACRIVFCRNCMLSMRFYMGRGKIVLQAHSIEKGNYNMEFIQCVERCTLKEVLGMDLGFYLELSKLQPCPACGAANPDIKCRCEKEYLHLVTIKCNKCGLTLNVETANTALYALGHAAYAWNHYKELKEGE